MPRPSYPECERLGFLTSAGDPDEETDEAYHGVQLELAHCQLQSRESLPKRRAYYEAIGMISTLTVRHTDTAAGFSERGADSIVCIIAQI
jgi:hypothetical protein